VLLAVVTAAAANRYQLAREKDTGLSTDPVKLDERERHATKLLEMVSPTTQRATKGFPARNGPKVGYVILRNPPMSLPYCLP